MKRRTLDLMFSVGGLIVAGLLLVMGVVLTSNANFAKDYTESQLAAQQIKFKAVDKLTDAEKAGAACAIGYAGQELKTGKQAECYSKYIGVHVASTAEGRTYATQGDFVNGLKAELSAAQKANPVDQAKIDDLNKEITAGTAARETLFKGETLKGLLLTSYGFSVFGTKGGVAAKNIVVILTSVFFTSAFGLDPAGNPKLDMALTGTGPGIVFRDGRRQEVTWTRPDIFDVFTFTNAAGEAVRLAPGQTWIQIVPNDWTIPSQ